MAPGSTLHTSNLWAEDSELARPVKVKPEKPRKRKKLYGKRKHRFRHYKPGTKASGRVSNRMRKERRMQTFLRVLAVPALALVPASVYFLDYPLNLVVAPSLGVMGLVLMFGSK